jgi:glycerol uptake facilitator-like aquaporin
MNLVKKGVAEFLGVTLFLTAIVGSTSISGTELPRLALATTLALMILLTAGISGGHLNPAVSLYFYAKKQLGLSELLAYLAAQLLGGLAGTHLGAYLAAKPLAGPSASGTAPEAQFLVGEIVATAVLVWIVGYLAANDKGNLIPWAVGLWVSAAAAFTLTGAQANPAVTFGLMFTGKGVGETGWLVIAQLVGTVFAMLLLSLFGKAKKN